MASEITDRDSGLPFRGRCPARQHVRMHTLFVYGTLRHPPLIEGLLGRPVAAVAATLPGHRAAVLSGRAYPGLVVDPEASAAGAVVAVDDAELAVLDDFEGSEYTRTHVTVTTEGGEPRAEAYLLTGPSRSLATADTWSLDAFVADHAAAWVRQADPGTHHPTA